MNRRENSMGGIDGGGGRRPWAPSAAQATKYEKPPAYQLTAEDRQVLEEQTAELEQAMARLPRIESPHRDAGRRGGICQGRRLGDPVRRVLHRRRTSR